MFFSELDDITVIITYEWSDLICKESRAGEGCGIIMITVLQLKILALAFSLNLRPWKIYPSVFGL